MITDRGQRLKEERERLGLSQEKLAQLCGTSKRSQIMYEQGRAPTADYLAAFDAAGGDVLYVVTGQRTDDRLSLARLGEAVRIVAQAMPTGTPSPDPEKYARIVAAAYAMLDGSDLAINSRISNLIRAMS